MTYFLLFFIRARHEIAFLDTTSRNSLTSRSAKHQLAPVFSAFEPFIPVWGNLSIFGQVELERKTLCRLYQSTNMFSVHVNFDLIIYWNTCLPSWEPVVLKSSNSTNEVRTTRPNVMVFHSQILGVGKIGKNLFFKAWPTPYLCANFEPWDPLPRDKSSLQTHKPFPNGGGGRLINIFHFFRDW